MDDNNNNNPYDDDRAAYSGRCAEENLIMFKDCSSLQGCPTHTGKTVSPRNLVPGTEFNWTADSAVISGAFYVVKFTLENTDDSCGNTASVSLDISAQNWPPFIQSLPNSIAIKEDTPPNEVIYTTEVNDLYGDPVCCTLSHTHPQTFNFNVTNDPPGSSLYHVVTTRTARFRYEDFNSYMIYMCCDDTQNRAEGVLIVNIKKPVVTTPYTPPKWFFTSIAVGMIPITIITTIGCGLLWLTIVQSHLQDQPLRSAMKVLFVLAVVIVAGNGQTELLSQNKKIVIEKDFNFSLLRKFWLSCRSQNLIGS
uniref:Uncharacterized protein n=1 Tax=Magallana gigas TaxID=29159 RepID=K1PXP7_MAGGI